MATSSKAGSSGESATTTTAKTTSGDVVEYTGTADEVKISSADFKKVGVEGQEQVVFNRENQFKVDASSLSAEALDALRKDSRFKVPGTEA